MSEITKTEDRKPTTGNRLVWPALALLAVAVYFIGLDIPLLGPDEPRYSQVAREMFERGDWVTPTLGGFDWFEKPALLYWLQIAAYNVFGVSEFAARFGSALFGLGTALSVWIIGKQWSAVSGRWSAEKLTADYANWLALVAASSLGLLVFSRGASFDIILTFPIAAALAGFFVWDTGRAGGETESTEKPFPATAVSAAGLACFYIFIGVALIAKGLVGLVFPFAIVAFYHLLSWKRPSKSLIFSLFWGTALSALVASAWYLPMYRANGWKFIDEFFIQHHFQRYTSNKYQHPQPFYFFFWVLPLMTLPWMPFLIAAVWKAAKDARSAVGGRLTALNAFALAWLLVPLVFFSFSGSKLPGYILPAVPAALILAGDYIYRFVQKPGRRRVVVQALAALTLIGVAVLSQFETELLREETVRHLVKTADESGYRDEKIMSLHTISHSMEFYGAGRLIREETGRQKRFYGVTEIVQQMERDDLRQTLVVIPLNYLNTLTESPLVETRVLDNNGELAIVFVKRR
jgi:4-amino-4-deoxy-L-arabinose transferase-like glycosyltransferase